MEKMKMETPDGTKKNIERVKALFPNVITEMKDEKGNLKEGIDFERLKQELSGDVVEGTERYDFTWVGKKAAILEAHTPIRKTLRPCIEESKDWETTENLYIEGDNLDVLKLLQESYLGKVKMIYIDPPYNTGNDFLYNDNFTMDKEEYEDQIELFDEEGHRLFRNTESNGQFHSDWCSMMYPRLKLARTLLSEDGVIFISIDENEVYNLMKICEEVFGANSIDVLIWRKNGKQGNTKKINRFKNTHEYILGIYKNKNDTRIGKMKLLPNWKNEYPNPDNDPRGNYEAGNISLMEEKSNKDKPNYYSITTPTGVVYTREWFIPKVKFYELDNDKVATSDGRMVGRIYYPNNGNGVPRLKIFRDEEQEYYFDTIIDEMGTFTDAKSEIEELYGNKDVFDTPKPTKILKELIRASTRMDDVILDFFSGSATAAHAVMQLNAEDGGHRKFIMVQLQEPCDEKSEAFKAGYKNICEIGKERIRRAGEKIKEEVQGTNKQIKMGEEPKEVPDIGFRVFKADSTNMKDVYYAPHEYSQERLLDFESNIKEERTELDLLYGVLLEWGLPLSLKHEMETVEGIAVHTIDHNALIACFACQVPENVFVEIAKRQPLRAVFRDGSFSSSQDKINAWEIFKEHAPNTQIKVL